MNEVIRKMMDTFIYIHNHQIELFGKSAEVEELMETYDPVLVEKIYNKYYLFLSDYISNPDFFPSLELDKMEEDELHNIIFLFQLFIPKRIYYEIFRYYNGKINNLLNYSIINTKEDIDFYISMGYTVEEIIKASHFYTKEELIKYAISLKTTDGVIDPEFYEYIINNKIDGCLFILLEELKKGHYDLLYNFSKIKDLVEALLDENIPNTKAILDRILLMSRKRNIISVITDTEKAKKIISLYGSKYIVFIDNPTEEIVSMINDFDIEDYKSIRGDYKKSPHLLKLLLKKGDYEALEYTLPEAITEEIVDLLSKSGINLSKYENNSSSPKPLVKSLAYNKYLVKQGRFEYLHCIHDLYKNLESFDFVYSVLQSNKEKLIDIKGIELSIIKELLDKKNRGIYYIDCSLEVAKRIVSLGFTLENYVESNCTIGPILQLFIKQGDNRARLINFDSIELEMDNISYEDFLSLKRLRPNITIVPGAALTLIKEGHYDVIEHTSNIESIIKHLGLDKITEEQYKELPNQIKKIKVLKDKFNPPSREEIIKKLNDDPDSETISMASKSDIPYLLIKKCIDNNNYGIAIEAKELIKFLHEGHREVLKYATWNLRDEESSLIVEIFYNITNGDIPTEEEWGRLGFNLQEKFIEYYLSQGKYEILLLEQYINNDKNHTHILKERNYSISDFKRVPIFKAEILKILIQDGYIDDILEILQNNPGVIIPNATDFIILLYRSNLPKEKLSSIAKYCDINVIELMVKVNDNELDILNYLNLEKILNNSENVPIIISKLNPYKIKMFLKSNAKKNDISLNLIISYMVNNGNPSYIEFYEKKGNDKILKKALLSGYMPSISIIKNSEYLSTAIPQVSFSHEEKEKIKKYLDSNPCYIIYLLDEYEENKSFIIDYIKESPSVFQLIPNENKTKIDIVIEVSKKDPTVVADLFPYLSLEDGKKLIEINHELVHYIDSICLTEAICKIVIADYPEIIDRKIFISDDLIKLAFDHGYKVNKNSKHKTIKYALNNKKTVLDEIWDEENISTLLNFLEDHYDLKTLKKVKYILDNLFKKNPEIIISKIVLSNLNRNIALLILKTYGFTEKEYDTLVSYKYAYNLEKMIFLITLKKIEKLTKEEQIKKISELCDSTNYIKECFIWLKYHGLMPEAKRIAAEKYESDPLTCITYCQDKLMDKDFIEKTKKIIKKDPEKYYSLANNVTGVLNDKAIALLVIKHNPKIYRILPEELKKDPEIINASLEMDLSIIKNIPTDIPNYKELCYKVLKEKGIYYYYLSICHNDKEALKIAIKTYPQAIESADISIIDEEIISLITDFKSISFDTMNIEKVKKIIKIDSLDISNPDILGQVLELVKNGMLDINFDKKITKCIVSQLNTNPEFIYKKYFQILLEIDESLLTEEQITERNKAKQLLEEYGKVNTLDKNPIFSYDLVKYVLPVIGLKHTTNLMKYNSGIDKIIIELINEGKEELIKSYIDLIQKYHIFVNDDKMLHFAFRYFENYKSLISDIIDKDLTPQEVTYLTKIIMNENPYNIQTREELTKYEEVVTEYAKKMSESPNIDEVKNYFSIIFGFAKFDEFEKYFRNHQLDNFPQIQFVMKDVEKKYGEELAKKLRFTTEEAKVLLLMKEVIETKNIEELHKILKIGIKTEKQVLDYSDVVYAITLKVRKLYNYQFNANLTKIDSLKEKLKNKTSEYKRTITDYRGEKKEASVKIIDMNEEPFNFLVHRVGSLDVTGAMEDLEEMLRKNPSLWTKLDGASTLSTSSISDRGMWTIKNDGDLIYVFDEIPEDFLICMYGEDLWIADGGHTFEPGSSFNCYTDLNSLNQSTCVNHKSDYNEVAGYRAGVIPKAILCTGIEPNEEQIRAADYFEIPIIRVDIQKYEDIKLARYNAALRSMKEKTTPQAIYDIMYSGIVGHSLSDTIDLCIDFIKSSYKSRKITYHEMLEQLIQVRQLANRISEPNNKQVIRKVDLIIQTTALEGKVTQMELIEIEDANMGESGIMYRLQEGKKEFLLKPSVDKQYLRSEPFRAEIQKAAAKLQKILSPDTAVPVEVLGTGILRVSKQEKIPLSSNPNILINWANRGGKLDQKIVRQLLQEYVVDYLLCNFDCFAGNFVIDSNGNLRGVDKEQSFRFIDSEESLDPSFSYTPNGSSRIPIYQILFNRYNSGQIDLDFSIIDEKLAILEEMSDVEYEVIFRPYAEALNKEHPEIILEKILKRKNECVERLKRYISEIRKDNPTREGDAYNGK